MPSSFHQPSPYRTGISLPVVPLPCRPQPFPLLRNNKGIIFLAYIHPPASGKEKYQATIKSEGKVNQVNASTEATPKTILRIMNIRGLTLYHLKSHLQKYRLGKQSRKEILDNSSDASSAAESWNSKQSALPSSSILLAQELNDGCNEAMRVQMELQRRLHEQLEVQKHIQVRIEAQGQYLQSILERACNILLDPNLGVIENDSVRHELSELPTRESDGCVNFQCESLKTPSLSELTVACMPQITECSMDSCLTSTRSPGKVSVLKKRPRPLLGTD